MLQDKDTVLFSENQNEMNFVYKQINEFISNMMKVNDNNHKADFDYKLSCADDSIAFDFVFGALKISYFFFQLKTTGAHISTCIINFDNYKKFEKLHSKDTRATLYKIRELIFLAKSQLNNKLEYIQLTEYQFN